MDGLNSPTLDVSVTAAVESDVFSGGDVSSAGASIVVDFIATTDADAIPQWAAFLLAVVLISLSPGPAFALIIRTSALHGWRRAMAPLAGVEVGIAVWATLAAVLFMSLFYGGSAWSLAARLSSLGSLRRSPQTSISTKALLSGSRTSSNLLVMGWSIGEVTSLVSAQPVVSYWNG